LADPPAPAPTPDDIKAALQRANTCAAEMASQGAAFSSPREQDAARQLAALVEAYRAGMVGAVPKFLRAFLPR